MTRQHRHGEHWRLADGYVLVTDTTADFMSLRVAGEPILPGVDDVMRA